MRDRRTGERARLHIATSHNLVTEQSATASQNESDLIIQYYQNKTLHQLPPVILPGIPTHSALIHTHGALAV